MACGLWLVACGSVGVDKPANIRTRLVLPLPLVPRSQVMRPGGNCRFSPPNSWRRPRRQPSAWALSTPASAMRAGAPAGGSELGKGGGILQGRPTGTRIVDATVNQTDPNECNAAFAQARARAPTRTRNDKARRLRAPGSGLGAWGSPWTCSLTKECYQSGCCRSGCFLNPSMVDGCGHVVEGGGGGQRSRAAVRCPRSAPVRRRCIVHMSRPAGRERF